MYECRVTLIDLEIQGTGGGIHELFFFQNRLGVGRNYGIGWFFHVVLVSENELVRPLV